MTYDDVITDVVRAVEATGAAIMVIGGLVALIAAGMRWLKPAERPGTYEKLRRTLGRTILLGLEILIIGDIVRTIVVDPTLESVAVLAGIVILRIILSFSLEIEIDGTVPWRRTRSPEG